MKTTKYRQEELEQARELQKQARNLHLPSPPVASWEATIKDENGAEKEFITSKCNSYTRNGLNLIATAGFCVTVDIQGTEFATAELFEDGVVSYKTRTGTIVSRDDGFAADARLRQRVILGTDDTAESIDHVSLTNIASLTNVSVIAFNHDNYFDPDTRKLVAIYETEYINARADSISIKEAGIVGFLRRVGTTAGTADVLFVRDLLSSAITLGPSEKITFRYKFETLF